MPKIDFGVGHRAKVYAVSSHVSKWQFMEVVYKMLEDEVGTDWSLWDADQLELLARKVREVYTEKTDA